MEVDKNKPYRRDIIKTESIYVGKRIEIAMFVLAKLNEVQDSSITRIDRNIYQKNDRLEKREEKRQGLIDFYKITLFEEKYVLEKIERNEVPKDLKARRGVFILSGKNEGYFKGKEETIRKVLHDLY